jgi:hypothetical protein
MYYYVDIFLKLNTIEFFQEITLLKKGEPMREKYNASEIYF